MSAVEHYYQGIEGNFTFEDLYAYAARHAVNPPVASFSSWRPMRAVEIGVANGRSAAFLAVEMSRNIQVLDAKMLRPSLALVDNSQGNLTTTMHNLTRCADYVDFKPVWLDSVEAAKVFEDGSLDFVFIDGDHAYEPCLRDIAAWLPKVRPGGILAGHDYVVADWSGVIEAVNQSFDRYEVWRGSQWTDGKRYPSWLVRVA